MKRANLDEVNFLLDEPLNIISGKSFFKLLSDWTREEYGVRISARQIVSYLYHSEVPAEIKVVIDTIMQGK